MKPAPLIAALSSLCILLLAFPSPLRAGTVNCVPEQGCPKDTGPPDCCEPPPCEFQQQLKFARAYRDSIKDIALGMSFVEGADAAGSAAETRWASQAYQAFSDLLDQASPCPVNPFFQDPPLLKVVPELQCEIMYWADEDNTAGPATLEDINDNVNACEEVVDARWSKAKAQRDACLAERYGSNQRTLAERMMQDLAEAEAELDALETHQKFYEDVCTVAPDSQAAQQAVDDDLVPLLPENDIDDDLVPLTPDPPKPKKSKRSGKKSGRR